MHFKQMTKGWIELICGPMFAGKTEELLRTLNKLEYAKINYLLFKPDIDKRYKLNKVTSHSGIYKNCITIKNSKEIFNYIDEKIKVIAIDEVQFFDEEIVDLVDDLANKGFKFLITGLDLDFRAEPFNVVSKLLSKAEIITKLKGICQKCGMLSTRTQRIINGKIADYNDPVILVGADEYYESRCRNCYRITNNKNF